MLTLPSDVPARLKNFPLMDVFIENHEAILSSSM
jgi:hypothetical protein